MRRIMRMRMRIREVEGSLPDLFTDSLHQLDHHPADEVLANPRHLNISIEDTGKLCENDDEEIAEEAV